MPAMRQHRGGSGGWPCRAHPAGSIRPTWSIISKDLVDQVLLDVAGAPALGEAADRLGLSGRLLLGDEMRLAFDAQCDLALVVVNVGELLELAVIAHRGG